MIIFEVFLILLVLGLFIETYIRGPSKGRHRYSSVRVYKTTASQIPELYRPPVTPEPDYICENCGMLIRTGNGHTREECESYAMEPLNPDLRAHKTILPGRNDPKVREPYYYEAGTFKNWGAGK